MLLAFFILHSSFFIFTACDDFLSIVPLNDIVLENYWTEEADVNSVLLQHVSRPDSPTAVSRHIAY